MNIAVNKIYFRNKKDNWLDFRKILDANNIQYFYHFTDHRNIENIKSAGGLYSWLYLEKNNIKTYSGGNNKSRERDIEVGFENYVRLSFVKDHPMKHICVGDKRIKDPITLCISTDVAYISDTWFSNKNANRGDATIFNRIEKFKELKFDIFSKSYFDVERSSLDRKSVV